MLDDTIYSDCHFYYVSGTFILSSLYEVCVMVV
jgi:hypothetical protein